MVKRYITWQPFWQTQYDARHIDANINMNWNYETNPITCQCLPYGNNTNDKRMLAILDIPEVYSEAVIDRLYKSCYSFAITNVTPEKALELCNEWYGENIFVLDEDGFTLIDNREIEQK